MHALFEYLARRDLNPRSAPPRIARWNNRALIKFLSDAEEIVRESWSFRESKFSFVANSSLSGGTRPCSSQSCRLKHADRLGRFAVLYGDQVTIQNPLMEVREVGPRLLEWNRDVVLGSLQVLWHLRPLIDAGFVAIVNPAIHFCEDHLPDIVKSGTLDQISEELTRQYYGQMTITPTAQPGGYSLSGPESLLEHPTVTFYATDHPRKTALRLLRRGTGEVSEDVRRSLVQHMVRPILLDIIHQHVLGADYGARYVTDRDVDFLALRQTVEPDLREVSRALAEGLSHSVPTLEQLPLKDLLRLRHDEGEVFRVYRDALARVLQEITPADSGRVRQAFQDRVLPELNKIDALVANEQKRLRRSAAIDLMLGFAAVSLCLFPGLLTAEAGRLLAEVAGGTYAGRGIRRLAGLPTEPEDKVRDRAYYFLWRAREEAHLPR